MAYVNLPKDLSKGKSDTKTAAIPGDHGGSWHPREDSNLWPAA